MGKYQDKLNEFGLEVLKAIESGKAPWQKPWKEGELLEIPKNATTDNSYKGVNLINLAMSGYNDPRWLTFNQAKKMDCKVRKGEKSRAGFYYSPTRLEAELDNGKPVLDDNGKEKMVTVNRPVFKSFALFNATQVEGMEPYKQPEPSWKPEEKAEKLLNASGMTIVESQLDRAFYRPTTHTIETPAKAQFRDKSEYYSTMFHELAHATGHPDMLNRDKETKSNEGRAKEELRAEISAWLICTQIGIGYDPAEQENNKNYVAGWLSSLEDKDRAKELGFAMKDAEKIADYILSMDREQSVDTEYVVKGHYIIADESMTGISDKKTFVDAWGSEAAKFDNPEAALIAALSAKATMKELEDDEVSVYKITEFGDTEGPLVRTDVPIAMKGMWERNIKTPFPENILSGEKFESVQDKRVENEKTYIHVPYTQKDEVKKLGAKWDRDQKSWFIEPGSDKQLFQKWLNLQENKNSQAVLDGEKRRGEREPESRVYINVPYSQKDEAKDLGAKWDTQEKSWFLKPGTDQAPFKKWLVSSQETHLDMNKVTTQFQDPQVEFANNLKDAGLKLEGLPQMDGKLHRVPVEGDKKGKTSGAYKGYLDGHPAGFIQNFKSGLKTNWKATGQRLNSTELIKLKEEVEAKKQAREREKEAIYNAKAIEANQEWTMMPDASADHPYLKNKNLQEVGHVEGIKQDNEGNLVIPIKDKNDKIWSLQRIGPNGFKGYKKDAKVEGCYYIIGGKDALKAQDEHEPVIISSGFSTSASINIATGRPVVVAFQDNNLEKVAQEFKQTFPRRTIAILGDDDRHLPKRTPPLPNSGRKAATKAAQAVNGKAIFPQFTAQEKGSKFTDFSDLHRIRGLSTVKQQIEQGLAQSKEREVVISGNKQAPAAVQNKDYTAADGQKQFLTGGKKSGNAYTIGEIDEQKPILLAEGFATGKTLNDVSHLPAVVCFDANNLENVAKQIRELMPSAELFICADNDHAQKNNVGVEKAQKAAKAVGAKVIIPKFTDESKKLGYTDFNDLAKCKMGKSRVQNQLKSQIKYLSKNKGIGLER